MKLIIWLITDFEDKTLDTTVLVFGETTSKK